LLKEIYKLSGVIIPFATTLLSMMVFLSSAGQTEYLKYAISLSGAFVGAVVVYIFASLRAALHAPKVYISYAQQDYESVDLICKSLESIRVEILLDRSELLIGDNIQKKLNSMVESSDYIIYVHSINSAKSKWSVSELDKALSSDKKVLPIVIDDEPLPEGIEHLMYADFRTDPKGAIKNLKKVFAGVKHNKSSQSDA